MRPVVINLFQFFGNEKFDLKQFDLLKSNRILLDKLDTDDITEKSDAISKVKVMEGSIKIIKLKLKQVTDTVSMYGIIDDKQSRIIGESSFSNIPSPMPGQRTLPLDSVLANNNTFNLLLGKSNDVAKKK